MDELIAHAKMLGVTVATATLPSTRRGVYDHARDLVVYDHRLTPVERRCVLAHELGHVYHGHTTFGDARAERAADEYAARLLIDPAAHAAAERLDPSPAAIAEELGVEERLVRVFEDGLLCVSGASYVRARLGAGGYSWRGFR